MQSTLRHFLALFITLSATFFTQHIIAELKSEPIYQIETLPESYSKDWVFAHDTNFRALMEGKVILVDVVAKTKQYKGMIGSAQFGTFIESSTRPELYVGETFYTRLHRGERTDVITIYDKTTLNVIDEIKLPQGKRGLFVTQKAALRLIDNDRFLLISSFTPAASVLVIDLNSRKLINEINISGCNLIYPTGTRGFSSLCSDGSMVTFILDEAGQIIKDSRVTGVINIEQDPLFEKNFYIDGIAYHPSFKGMMQPIDLSGDKAKVLKPWSMLTRKDQKEKWRPGGWQIVSGHHTNKVFVLMHPDGYNGSHKGGGSEVWVFDVKKRKRIKRIKLDNWGVSIEVTSSNKPHLVVTNGDMNLDIYDAVSGKFIHRISEVGAMPLAIHAIR